MKLEVVLDEQVGHRLGISAAAAYSMASSTCPCDDTMPPHGAVARCVLAPELELQKLAEQMVIAIPLAATSRGTRNMFERASSASTAAESSRPRTASHSSGVKRVSTELRSRKSRVSGASAARTSSVQIVADVARAAGKCLHALVGVVELAEPQRREVKPGRPSLRPVGQHLDALVDSFTPSEAEFSCLVDCEDQLVRADLGQCPSRA